MAGNSGSPLDGEFHQATPLIPPGPPALSPLLRSRSVPAGFLPPATRFPLVLNAIFTFLDFLGEGFRGSINFASSGVEGADVWHGAPPERWLDLEAKLQMVVFFEQGQQSKPFLSEFCPCPPGAAEEQLPLVAAETVPVAEPSKISEEWRISFGIQVVFCQTWLPGWE